MNIYKPSERFLNKIFNMTFHVVKVVLCCLVASVYAGVLQLSIQAQHNIDDSIFTSGQASLGRPVKVKSPPLYNSLSAL